MRPMIWRREWDSNPRYGYPYTRSPGVRLRPLGHPSAASVETVGPDAWGWRRPDPESEARQPDRPGRSRIDLSLLRTSPIDKRALAKIKLFGRARPNGSRSRRAAPIARQARISGSRGRAGDAALPSPSSPPALAPYFAGLSPRALAPYLRALPRPLRLTSPGSPRPLRLTSPGSPPGLLRLAFAGL